MKVSDLKSLTQNELNERLSEEKKSLSELVFKKAVTGQIEKPHMLKTHRRNIARINTILRETQMADINA